MFRPPSLHVAILQPLLLLDDLSLRNFKKRFAVAHVGPYNGLDPNGCLDIQGLRSFSIANSTKQASFGSFLTKQII